MKTQHMLKTLIVALALTIASGCGPEGPRSALEKTFRAPAPTGAKDDPIVADTGAASNAIAEKLKVVHDKLQAVRSAYEAKADIQGDLKEVAEKMKTLVTAARTDCDTILRAAKDLRFEFNNAGESYKSAAATFRKRAAGYKDPAWRAVMLGIADEYEEQASDFPRRAALTDKLIANLEEAQEFLAESERGLRDTATAMAVLSVGKDRPGASAEGRAFHTQLGQFIAAVEEYVEKFHRVRKVSFPSLPKTPPATPAEAPHKKSSPTPPAPAEVRKPQNPLPAGSVWVGESRQGRRTFACTTYVTESEGGRVEGETEMETPDGTGVFAFTGTVSGTRVRTVSTVKRGRGLTAGTDEGTVVDGVWSATWVAGRDSGTFRFVMQKRGG